MKKLAVLTLILTMTLGMVKAQVDLNYQKPPKEILDMADEIRSTSGMIAFTKASDRKEFIIGTEIGILYPLSKESPDKTFVPAHTQMTCPDMKKTGLKDILASLKSLEPEVKVPEEIRKKAKAAVDRMLAIPGK